MKKIMFNDKYGLTNAVLVGRKTQTRRICNLTLHDLGGNQYFPERIFHQDGLWKFELRGRSYNLPKESQPQYQIGDIVAVAQNYRTISQEGYPVDSRYDEFRQCNWGENKDGALENSPGWNNKMFVRAGLMPYKIHIANVRAEHLQDIPDDDCIKEGIQDYSTPNERRYGYSDFEDECIVPFRTPREAYAALMDKISGKGTWESNPYVFVYEFEFIK